MRIVFMGTPEFSVPVLEALAASPAPENVVAIPSTAWRCHDAIILW